MAGGRRMSSSSGGAARSEGGEMPTIETVAGQIDASALGFTLSHEHVLVSMGADNIHYPWLFDRAKTRANAVLELSQAKAGGVDTIIDLTTPDLGRDVAFVRDVAEEAGINVVVATGIWRDVPRSFWARDPERIADIFCREIEVGIGDTGIKAGVIKVANDAEGVRAEAEACCAAPHAHASGLAVRSAHTSGRLPKWAGGRSRSSARRAR
jgi:phosphotriesterase-related protein